MKKLFPDDDCYLDMDGVLVNMHEPILKAHNALRYLSEWPNLETNDLRKVLDTDNEGLWQKIPQNNRFWWMLEPYPWVNELVEFLVNNFNTVRILTHPQDNRYCYGEKLEWIQRYINHPLKVIYCEEKYLLSGPNRLLIDDTPHLVKEWRKRGGRGIVFPRVWNTTSIAHKNPCNYTIGHLFGLAINPFSLEPWEVFPVETPKGQEPGPVIITAGGGTSSPDGHTYDSRPCPMCGDLEGCSMGKPVLPVPENCDQTGAVPQPTSFAASAGEKA